MEAKWIRNQIDENKKLEKAGYRLLLDEGPDFPQEAKNWHRRFIAQLNAKPLTPRDDYVPGVSRVIYEDLGKFEPVRTAQKEWKTSKENLTSVSGRIQKELQAGS
jgi:hypothetical protein